MLGWLPELAVKNAEAGGGEATCAAMPARVTPGTHRFATSLRRAVEPAQDNRRASRRRRRPLPSLHGPTNSVGAPRQPPAQRLATVSQSLTSYLAMEPSPVTSTAPVRSDAVCLSAARRPPPPASAEHVAQVLPVAGDVCRPHYPAGVNQEHESRQRRPPGRPPPRGSCSLQMQDGAPSHVPEREKPPT